jgi:hypothetical protein
MNFPYDWIWVGLALYFCIAEGIALMHNRLTHPGDWTLTAFIKVIIPLSIRVPLLAWLVYHFVFQH